MTSGEKKEGTETPVSNPTESKHSDITAGNPVPDTDHESAALKAVEIAQKEILYIRAEFENYKKRIVREQEQAIRFGNKMLIADMLTVFDLLERATQHAQSLKSKNDADVNNFISGVEMTANELAQLMQRNGVEFVGTVGEAFDPEKHEAISQEGTDPDTVVQVLQKGCRLHGKLLKPAKVVVGKKS